MMIYLFITRLLSFGIEAVISTGYIPKLVCKLPLPLARWHARGQPASMSFDEVLEVIYAY